MAPATIAIRLSLLSTKFFHDFRWTCASSLRFCSRLSSQIHFFVPRTPWLPVGYSPLRLDSFPPNMRLFHLIVSRVQCPSLSLWPHSLTPVEHTSFPVDRFRTPVGHSFLPFDSIHCSRCNLRLFPLTPFTTLVEHSLLALASCTTLVRHSLSPTPFRDSCCKFASFLSRLSLGICFFPLALSTTPVRCPEATNWVVAFRGRSQTAVVIVNWQAFRLPARMRSGS